MLAVSVQFESLLVSRWKFQVCAGLRFANIQIIPCKFENRKCVGSCKFVLHSMYQQVGSLQRQVALFKFLLYNTKANTGFDWESAYPIMEMAFEILNISLKK